MVHFEVNSPSYDGSKWNRPVILPLPKAGDNRCSVKPASRSTLHSKNHENRSFRSIPSAQTFGLLNKTNPCPSSLMLLLRLQACVTKLSKL
ncbi:hypothetical protein ERO13_D07G026400v2 [Gossypium hirsutum]|nr:hypothetical protein ERO13_D07G026400v2 [Gossypium hirsutum]